MIPPVLRIKRCFGSFFGVLEWFWGSGLNLFLRGLVGGWRGLVGVFRGFCGGCISLVSLILFLEWLLVIF